MEKEQLLLKVRGYLSIFGFKKSDEKILEAMSKIDRKFFVPEKLRDRAYVDGALGIEKGQTISQPSTVARMLSLLELRKDDAVLEIGTGSGWNASLIAYIVNPGKVTSLEIHYELFKKAQKRIKDSEVELKNLELRKGDFRKLKDKFDKIIFTAGMPAKEDFDKTIMPFAEKKLADNGILVCPMQSGPLIVLKKDKAGKLIRTFTTEDYIFVPLILD